MCVLTRAPLKLCPHKSPLEACVSSQEPLEACVLTRAPLKHVCPHKSPLETCVLTRALAHICVAYIMHTSKQIFIQLIKDVIHIE